MKYKTSRGRIHKTFDYLQIIPAYAIKCGDLYNGKYEVLTISKEKKSNYVTLKVLVNSQTNKVMTKVHTVDSYVTIKSKFDC